MLKQVITAALGAIVLLAAPAAAQGPRVPHHAIEITVDIPSRSMTGTDTIRPGKGAGRVELLLREGSKVDGVEIGGKEAPFETEALEGERASRISVEMPADADALTVSFSGTFPGIASAQEKIKRGVAYVDDGVIGPRGVFLPSSSLWYPREYGLLHTATARVTVGRGFRTVMEGELAATEDTDAGTTERWRTERPVDGLDLIAGRYVVREDEHRGVKVYTYFFKDEPDLSRLYIDRTKGYLDLYTEMIAPYPFKKFAVVESFLPTGYGMPSFTLLGSAILRLPFIPGTSLGHEIAHSWWGNSVFMDERQGNWVEALTTYVADYLYEREKGEGQARRFRLNKLRGFKNFAGTASIPLAGFEDATTPASRAVGYDKGMMVFNMLEGELGAETFGKGLKRLYAANAFRRASWAEVRAAFEGASGRDLKWFFDQWLLRSGGPVLRLGTVDTEKKDGGYLVSFTIEQRSPEPYRLTLPVVLRTAEGEVRKTIVVKTALDDVKIFMDSPPLGFTVDPGFQVFRVLADTEIPPSFASCFGGRGTVAVIPGKEKAREKYAGAAGLLSKDFGLELATDAGAGTRDFLGEPSLLIFGFPDENRVARLAGARLSGLVAMDGKNMTVGGRKYRREGTVAALAVKDPKDPKKTLCFFLSGASVDGTLKAARRLRYFSKYGYVVFPGGTEVEKGRFEAPNLLSYEKGR